MKPLLTLMFVVILLASVGGCSGGNDAQPSNAPTTTSSKDSKTGASTEQAGAAKPSTE